MVLVKAKPHKGYVTERARSSVAYIVLKSLGMENLVTKVTGSAKRLPGGTLPLPLVATPTNFTEKQAPKNGIAHR